MNTTKFKIEMLKKGDKNADLAAALNLSESRVSAKINGWNNAKFSDEEKLIIKDRYSLSEDIYRPVKFRKNGEEFL